MVLPEHDEVLQAPDLNVCTNRSAWTIKLGLRGPTFTTPHPRPPERVKCRTEFAVEIADQMRGLGRLLGEVQRDVAGLPRPQARSGLAVMPAR